jgi:membrane associated rhomboid family serine protease
MKETEPEMRGWGSPREAGASPRRRATEQEERLTAPPVDTGHIRRASDRARRQLTVLGVVVLIMWFLELVDVFLLGQRLNALGVRPRTTEGLWGILFMPLLHGNLAHVAANTLPFLVLGWLVIMRRLGDFLTVTAVVMIVSGVGVWLFGAPNTVSIGASGLVFGYFGFLVLRGYFERSATSIFIAVLVLMFYGGMFWGVLPQSAGISWEAHLFGFLGGVLAAWALARADAAARQ